MAKVINYNIWKQPQWVVKETDFKYASDHLVGMMICGDNHHLSIANNLLKLL